MMPVTIDVNEVLRLLRSGQVRAAVAAYGGDLMPGTESPALSELADFVAVAVREALLADPQPPAVARYTELAPYDTEVIEVCLAVMGDSPHPAEGAAQGPPRRRPPLSARAGDKIARMSLDLTSDVVALTEAVVDIESVSRNEKQLADAIEEALTGCPTSRSPASATRWWRAPTSAAPSAW